MISAPVETAPAHRSDARLPVKKRDDSSQVSIRRGRGLTRTFRRKALEEQFQGFCQLSSDPSGSHISRRQVEALQEEVRGFIDNQEFASRSADSAILGDELLMSLEADSDGASGRRRQRLNLPAHLAGMCEDRLLTAEQERQLFRRMNYFRYRATMLLGKIDANDCSQWDYERARGLIQVARWHRDALVRANTRLVISIVKKFVNHQCVFDDLLSDGVMALIRSVDKFDYELGFRFSTYATQVVRRNCYRFVMDRQDERLKISNGLGENGLDIAEDDSPSSMNEQRWHELRSRLSDLLNHLEKREKFIIRARFSLGGHRRVQTLQKLADKLGISKERVRQLEKRAMEKLQRLAVDSPLTA